jgi:hypothetical protein
MFKFIRTLLASKIHINITLAQSIDKPHIEHRRDQIISVTEKKFTTSDFRFNSHEVFEGGGHVQYFYTSKYNGTYWDQVDGTWTNDKQKALQAFEDVLNNVDVQKKRTVDTVLIEGVTKEEALTWVALQK